MKNGAIRENLSKRLINMTYDAVVMDDAYQLDRILEKAKSHGCNMSGKEWYIEGTPHTLLEIIEILNAKDCKLIYDINHKGGKEC